MRIRVLHAAVLAAVVLAAAGCDGGREAAKPSGRVRVLATFLPVYVFTMNVARGVPGVEIDLMLPPAGGCPHDYQLTPGDAKKIASADALVANGGIEPFLSGEAERINPKIKIFETNAGLDTLGDAEDTRARNPHTWVSPANAAKQVLRIRDIMSGLDPANAKTYAANADAYAKKLEALGAEIRAAAAGFPNKKIATFHDAFDYFARDAGLEVVGYVEPAPGQSPSAGEASALVAKLKSARAAAVFSEPQYPSRMAATVAAEAGIPVAALDPVSQTDIEPPPADLYEKVMKKNLETLERTLGKGASHGN